MLTRFKKFWIVLVVADSDPPFNFHMNDNTSHAYCSLSTVRCQFASGSVFSSTDLPRPVYFPWPTLRLLFRLWTSVLAILKRVSQDFFLLSAISY